MFIKHLNEIKLWVKKIPIFGYFLVDIYRIFFPQVPLVPMYELNEDSIIVNHDAGFFSCCIIRLEAIINYYIKYKKPPKNINCTNQFNLYKDNINDDVSNIFFKEIRNSKINFNTNLIYFNTENGEEQFIDYSNINYQNIKPFIDKYFTPSSNIERKILNFKKSLNIDFSNTCGIRYRGTDKSLEMIQPSIAEILDKAILIKNKYPSIKFLLLSDEFYFIKSAKSVLGNCCLVIEDDHKSKLCEVSNFVATVYIMSKCKYLITTSGNAELWMRLFRGNNIGCLQWLRQKKYIYGVKNKYYSPGIKNYWYGILDDTLNNL